MLTLVGMVFAGYTFYLSPTGDDRNDGLTKATAWQSLKRASSANFGPSDQLLLLGGGTYEGNLKLTSGGSKDHPVVVRSEGKPSTILAATGAAIEIQASNVEIHDLVLRGSAKKSLDKNTGIALYAPKDQKFKNVLLDKVDISKFGSDGVSIYSDKEFSGGFDEVMISNVNVHGVYGTGIISQDGLAYLDKGFGHHKVTVRDCDVSGNFGGNGIILSGIDGGLVEYCRAANNTRVPGQSLGMWAWCARNVTFRYCIASGTRGTGDAGGFDLDGGTKQCVVEKSLSFDNDGIGFMHCDYPSAPRTEKNIMRDSVSIDDGRRSKGGVFGFGYVVWGSGLYECTLENNRAWLTKPYSNKDLSAAYGATFIRDDKVELKTQRLEGAKIVRNKASVDVKGGAFVDVGFPSDVKRQITFTDNRFYSALKVPFIENKKVIPDLLQWNKATGYGGTVTHIGLQNPFKNLASIRPRDLPKLMR